MSVDHFCGYCGFILNPKGYKRCIQCSFETRYCDADCLVGHRQHVHPNPWPLKEGTMSQSPELRQAVERVKRAIDAPARARSAFWRGTRELPGDWRKVEAADVEFDAALAAALRLAKVEGSYAAWLVLQECRARDDMKLWDAIAHDAPAELTAARAACEAQDG